MILTSSAGSISPDWILSNTFSATCHETRAPPDGPGSGVVVDPNPHRSSKSQDHHNTNQATLKEAEVVDEDHYHHIQIHFITLRNASSTLALVLADVSMNSRLLSLANCSPSSVLTARLDRPHRCHVSHASFSYSEY